MPYYRIVAWKNRLMSKLDQGIMDVKEWERFIAISNENSCTSMAEDMRKRLEYYAGIIKQQTGAKMNDKFTEDFIKEQLDVMEKFEKAECSSSPEYLAGRNAATQNYADALHKILLLEHEICSWCRDMSAVFDDGKKRVIEAERKVKNLHKIISKQQLKIERQAENITTLLHLYTSGKRSKSHKKLREKYRELKEKNEELKEALYKSEFYEVLKEYVVSPEVDK